MSLALLIRVPGAGSRQTSAEQAQSPAPGEFLDPVRGAESAADAANVCFRGADSHEQLFRFAPDYDAGCS